MHVVHNPVIPPSHHCSSLSRDLETICLKCLEKSPGRRYPSAHDLAEDLRRYQAGEPILARPVGVLMRLVMWCRREPALAGMAAALSVIVLVGFTGVATQWVRAERNYVEARSQEQRAGTNFKLARRAVDDSLTRISEDQLFNEPGLQGLRKHLLASALNFYQEFVKIQENDHTTRSELAEAYTRLGVITRDIGSIEEAKICFLKGLEMTGTAPDLDPHDVPLMSARAENLLELSESQFLSGQVADALPACNRAIAIYDALNQARPSDAAISSGRARAWRTLGSQQTYAGKLAEAEAAFRRAAAALEGLTGRKASQLLASVHKNLGDTTARAAGRMNDAIAEFQTDVTLREGLAREDPGDFWLRDELASSRLNLADYLVFLNRPAEALAVIIPARDLLEPLVHENPRVSRFRYALGLAHYVAGSCLLATGRPDDALNSYGKALEEMSRVARENPAEERYQSPGLSGIHLSMGEALRSTGELAASLRSMRASLEIQENSTAKDPESIMNQVNLAMVHRSIGNVQVEAGDAAAAILSARRAVEILERLVKSNPRNIMVLSELYQARLTTGAARRRDGQTALALGAFRQAETDLKFLISQDPSNTEYQAQLALCLARVCALERIQGRRDEASRCEEQARALDEKTPHDLPDRLFNLSVIRSVRIPLLTGSAADLEALRRKTTSQAIEALNRAARAGFRNAVWLRTDPDLEPIRARPEFQLLIENLEKPHRSRTP